jgi:hypothetical protein
MNLTKNLISDKIPFFLLLLYFFLSTSHNISSKFFIFYREFFFIIFSILSIYYIFNFKINLTKLFLRIEFNIFFISLLIFSCIFIIYRGEIDTEFYTSQISKNYAYLEDEYVISIFYLRKFIIFIPILFFFYLRGLNQNEIKKILMCIFFMSILNLISYHFFNSFFIKGINFENFFASYYIYSGTNTYMCLNSGLFAICVYNSLTSKFDLYFFLKVFVTSLLFYLILLSSGKAVILFSLLCLIFFMIVFVKKKMNIKFFTIFIVFLIFTHFFFSIFISIQTIKNEEPIEKRDISSIFIIKKHANKFSASIEKEKKKFSILRDHRLDLEPRKKIYLNFFEYLNSTKISSKEFWIGKGSLSSIVSGFHNDYMRHFYRFGFLGLFLSYLPILYFFFKFTYYAFRHFFFNDKSDKVYLTLVLSGFVPYYSLFGYPRESVFESIIFNLSMILIFALSDSSQKDNKKKVL